MNKRGFLDPARVAPETRREMATTETYRHALTTAFRSWHTLAVGAVLLALNAFLLIQGNSLINTGQPLQGWVVNIIAGYAFVSAIFLGTSPLSENSNLTEAFPGVFDHFKTFIVGGIFWALGTALITNPVTQLKTNDQMVPGAAALIIGGAFLLLAVLVGVAAAFVRPRK